MRLAHHLLRHPSGVWHFRLVVPRDLRPLLGRSIIKRSLGTRDPQTARACAYLLGAQYAHAFAKARHEQHSMDWDEYLRRIGKFEVQAPGGIAVKTNGTREDNAAALQALRLMLAQRGTPTDKAAKAKSQSNAPMLAEAVASYEALDGKTIKPNTAEQRARACRSFIDKIGGALRVDEVTRPMAAAWADGLQASGLTKRYVANMVSHVAQIFEAQIAKGHIEQNPVKGVVVLKAKEKKALRSQGHGWEPLALDALRLIYDPQNLRRVRGEHVRWGALMGLYTGARVSEIAQIFLRDFEEIDGVCVVKLTDDSDGQSLKTDASKRVVPLHPDLLRLGLWERVEALRALGHERLFPNMRIDSKAGAGNALSKGFAYYLGVLGIKPRRANGIVGFHSLRKTVIQTLQGAPLSAERRRALVGHEPGEDVHKEDYMRPWTPAELADFFPGLRWGEWLDFDALRDLLPLPQATVTAPGGAGNVAPEEMA